MIVFIMTGCDHLAENRYWVGHSTTVNPTMQVAVCSSHFNLDISEAANTDVD